jgi:hypothetical protein
LRGETVLHRPDVVKADGFEGVFMPLSLALDPPKTRSGVRTQGEGVADVARPLPVVAAPVDYLV